MKKKKLVLGLLSALLLQTAQADTLSEIYALALENDPQIRADRAQLEADLETKNIGRAALLPQISGSISKSETHTENSGQGQQFTSSSSDNSSDDWNISLRQPLFNLQAFYGYQQAKITSEQAESQFKANQLSLIIRTADAYFNVLRAIDNLSTANAEDKALAHQLEQTKQRFEVGLAAITDVHEAQAAKDNATASTLEAFGQLGIAYEALEVLTGQPHDSIAPLQETFKVLNPEPADRHKWVEFALSHNHSLHAAKLASEAARQAARASKAAHAPTLTASARFAESDSDGFNSGIPFTNEGETESYSLTLDIPIYSGGRTSAQRRQAHSRYLNAKETFNRAQRDTIQSTRSLHLQTVTDVSRVKARSQAITSSTSALEATQAGYEVGTRNLVDVLVAQRTLYESRRNYSNALYDYVLNMLRLKEVAGTLTPDDIEQLSQWLDKSKEISRSSQTIAP